MLNVYYTVLAILELALLHQCLPDRTSLATFPLFTAPSSISLLRRFAPRFRSIKRQRNSLVDRRNDPESTSLLTNLTSFHNPFYEFYLHQTQNDFIHNLLPVLQTPTIDLLNHHYHLNHLNHQFNNDLTNRLESRLDSRLESRLDSQLDNRLEAIETNNQLINSNQYNQNPHSQQSILIHHPIQHHYSFYHLHPHLLHHKQHPPVHPNLHTQVLNRISNLNLPIVNQSPFSLLNKVQHLKQKLKQQKTKLKPSKLLDYQLKNLKSLSKLNHPNKLNYQTNQRAKFDQQTTISPLNEKNSLTTVSPRTGYLEIGSTAHLNQFALETEGEDDLQYLDANNLDNSLDEVNNKSNELSDKIENKIVTSKFEANNNLNESSTNQTGNVINLLTPSLIRNDLEQLLKQIKPNFVNFNHQLDLKSKYAYDLIGSNSTTNFSQDLERENVQVDFRERTAPDISAGIFSRALGSLTNYLPSSMKIITRTSGCVGGTKCQFFLSCWISSGSLGSSCGPLSTCCITPSKQDIQPAFYGPVINDPNCGRSATRISRIVGGMDASFGQFPWQAFVQVGGSRCGGALVGQKHVVTAGHCVARSQHNPSDIRVTLGDYILNSDIESLPHEVFTVAEVKLHPNFRFTPQADRYDLAILVLDRNVQYRNNIKPICLPQKDANYLGRVAYVAGWGALSAGSKLRPKVLQHVNVPVIDNSVCEVWHRKRGINIKIHDEMICAGYQAGNKDACQGDSGGPLMLNEFGVWYLIGIVSAGYSCAKQYQPGIYHRVSSSSDWTETNRLKRGFKSDNKKRTD